jgi:PAS domain S-box-containing protein
VDLALMRFQNGRFRKIGGEQFASFGGVTAIAEDSGGTIWVLTPRGQLFSIVGDEIKKQASPNYEVGRQRYLVADPNGGFWLGAPTGTISYFRDGHLQTTSLSSPQGPVDIRAPFVDSDNSLLVPSSRGLYRLNHGQVSLFSSDNGLPCPETFNAIRDNHGALWVYTRCGMVRIAEPEWAKWIESPNVAVSVMILDALDGAQAGTGDSYQPRSSKAPEGRLWFETGVSVQMLDPDRLYENPLRPPVHIEDVIDDRKTYSPQNGLHLPALTRDLEIDYTALSFVVPHKVHFQYKLEGYDRDWQDAGTRRQAFYTNLPPRNYTFRVRACNNSGLWNEAGASLDFFVAPAYYQTNWFRFFCVAAFIGMLYGLHRWRVHQIKSQEKHLRDVVDTIPAMTFTTLSDGTSTFVNKPWAEYTGLSVEQSSGTGWQRAVHTEDLARYSEKWRISVATGQRFEDEARFRRAADGEYRWFLVRGVPLLDQHAHILRWYGTLTDIEDRKRAEAEREKLRQLEADLAHTNRVSTLGEMAASLAHEIKQPIAAAITTANSCIEWLAQEPPNLDRARAAAARIDKYGNRAAEIIDRIRSFYKKSPPQREWVDVNGIIHEMLTLLNGEATRHSVAMRTDLSAELPKIMVDRVQLQQVFMNLMLNAIEAMEDCRGELTVKSELQDGQLQFSVSDTGVGLPTEKMDEIFSAFFTTKPQGSGMGLAISRSIVESHGGRLWACAKSGGGATFHFTLPTQVTESSPLVT